MLGDWSSRSGNILVCQNSKRRPSEWRLLSPRSPCSALCKGTGTATLSRALPARTLGVRIDGLSRDILVALDRTVSPGTGGMSVALSVAGPRRVVQPDEPSKLRVAELGHRTLRSE